MSDPNTTTRPGNMPAITESFSSHLKHFGVQWFWVDTNNPESIDAATANLLLLRSKHVNEKERAAGFTSNGLGESYETFSETPDWPFEDQGIIKSVHRDLGVGIHKKICKALEDNGFTVNDCAAPRNDREHGRIGLVPASSRAAPEASLTEKQPSPSGFTTASIVDETTYERSLTPSCFSETDPFNCTCPVHGYAANHTPPALSGSQFTWPSPSVRSDFSTSTDNLPSSPPASPIPSDYWRELPLYDDRYIDTPVSVSVAVDSYLAVYKRDHDELLARNETKAAYTAHMTFLRNHVRNKYFEALQELHFTAAERISAKFHEVKGRGEELAAFCRLGYPMGEDLKRELQLHLEQDSQRQKELIEEFNVTKRKISEALDRMGGDDLAKLCAAGSWKYRGRLDALEARLADLVREHFDDEDMTASEKAEERKLKQEIEGVREIFENYQMWEKDAKARIAGGNLWKEELEFEWRETGKRKREDEYEVEEITREEWEKGFESQRPVKKMKIN